jgi:ankyrin repeat protein
MVAACLDKKERAVRVLLENGAAVGATAVSGHTALIPAACHGSEGAVCLLLEAGPTVDATDKDGSIPRLLCGLLILAKRRGCARCWRRGRRLGF